MAQWLRGCEVCNAGLCAEMDALIESGLSQRQAAKSLEAIQEKRLGEVVYTQSSLLNRYHRTKPKPFRNGTSPNPEAPVSNTYEPTQMPANLPPRKKPPNKKLKPQNKTPPTDDVCGGWHSSYCRFHNFARLE